MEQRKSGNGVKVAKAEKALKNWKAKKNEKKHMEVCMEREEKKVMEIVNKEIITSEKTDNYQKFIAKQGLTRINGDDLRKTLKFLENVKEKGYKIAEIKAIYDNLSYGDMVLNVPNGLRCRIKVSIPDTSNLTRELYEMWKEREAKAEKEYKEKMRRKYLNNEEAAQKFIRGAVINYRTDAQRGTLKDKIRKYDKETQNYILDVFNEIRQKAEQKEQERKERQDREEKQQKEKENWIKKHGSERLNLMLDGGYEYSQTYEIERGQKEFPDYAYNRAGERFYIEERANPRLKALKIAKNLEEKGCDAKVVWIEGEREDPGYLVEIKREAVAVYPDWSRYLFIKLI